MKKTKKRTSKARAPGQPRPEDALSDEQLEQVAGGVTNVLLTGAVSEPGGSSNSGDAPTETVSFTYGSIEWTYTQQKPDGSSSGSPVRKK
jgi:hypothetical protein